MSQPNRNRKWSSAAMKVQRARKASRPEWRSLNNPGMVNILESLEDNDLGMAMEVGEDSVDGPSHGALKISKEYWTSKEFTRLLLQQVLDTKHGHLLDYVDAAAEALKESQESLDLRKTFWSEIFRVLLERAVDSNDSKKVRVVLSAAFETTDVKDALGEPPLNSPSLIKASLKGNLNITKMLIQKGFRLGCSLFDKPEKETYLDDLPFHIKESKVDASSNDEIRNLHILRAMAQPCYVFGRYMAVSSKQSFKNDKSNETSKECNICSNTMFRKISGCSMAPIQSEEDTHCPGNDRYKPVSRCLKHLECNDPLLRAFEIMKIASKCADLMPEYREEYLIINQECSQIASSLLEQCNDTSEVILFLDDKVGANQYFRQESTKNISYPRLKIAIQNKHKEFVAHMFCQQILKDQFMGSVPWKNKGTRFKTLYCICQFFLTIPHILHWMIRRLIIDWEKSSERRRLMKDQENQDTDDNDNSDVEDQSEEKEEKPQKNGWKQKLYKFLKGPCNLDQPMNRFISFTWLYFIFMMLVGKCILTPLTDDEQANNNFHWYHNCLLVYTIGMVCGDVNTLSSVRSWQRAINFWTFFDIVMHALLIVSFCARKLMGTLYPCHDGCSPEFVIKREPYDVVSNCFFALAAVLSGLRVFYWFQLHDKIGPIVINLSKVVTDLLIFTLVFALIMASFAAALVPLRVHNLAMQAENDTMIDPRLQDDYDLSNLTFTFYAIEFFAMVEALFWFTLNPEEPGEYDVGKLDGIFAIFLHAVYAILVVIILMNLLIAVMNTTISKVDNRQEVYWKFTRIKIWIEFFGEENALPMPFGIFILARILIIYIVKWVREKRSKKGCLGNDKAQNIESPDVKQCGLTRGERRKYNDLMGELVQRYWKAQNDRDKGLSAGPSKMTSQTSFIDSKLESWRQLSGGNGLPKNLSSSNLDGSQC